MMQLLSEMDGFDERGEIRIIAATNRFDMLDRAILRPGRFDRLIEVPKPDYEGRVQIFKIHTRNMNLSDDVDFEILADEAGEVSGADVKAITTEARMFAIRDDRTEVQMDDFRNAWEDRGRRGRGRRTSRRPSPNDLFRRRVRVAASPRSNHSSKTSGKKSRAPQAPGEKHASLRSAQYAYRGGMLFW